MLDKIKEDLKKAITEFTIEDFNIYTMNELYMQVANKTNEVIEIVKLLQDYLDEQIFNDVENIEIKQQILENVFNQLIINAGNSNAEIVEARIDSDGTAYPKLANRLNKVDSQIKGIVNCKPMNILFLGGKNDGSEDIGSIINNYTDKYSIYLPVGIYKVTTPIVLKNSLIGASYSRNRYSTNNKGQTWLLSELSKGSLITIDETMTSTSLTISDLSIQLNSFENGIEIKTGDKRPLLNIEKVGIFNVEGVAINVIPTVNTSRLVMINNLVVFGKAFASESNGIYTNTKCPDCRFTNI